MTRVTAIMSFFACHTVTLRLFFFCDMCDSYNVTLTQEGKSDIPAIGYLAMYSFKDDAGVNRLANRPILKRKSTDGKFVNVPFPSI